MARDRLAHGALVGVQIPAGPTIGLLGAITLGALDLPPEAGLAPELGQFGAVFHLIRPAIALELRHQLANLFLLIRRKTNSRLGILTQQRLERLLEILRRDDLHAPHPVAGALL